VVADPDEIDGPNPAIDRSSRRLLEIRGYAEGPRAVISGAEREDRQFAAAGPVQTLRRLVDRSVAPSNHNSLYALRNGLGGKFGGVPWRLGENDWRGQTAPTQSFGNLRPLAAEPPTVCRWIDDDFHRSSLPDTARSAGIPIAAME
jgi:hypothetical protein